MSFNVSPCDLLDPTRQEEIERAAASADIGVCAADNEPAKYHWDELMRRHARAWTLGEVLSGGIGGFVHWFVPGGPCYGCVASHLQRAVAVEIVDSEMEALAAGGWRAFTNGVTDYPIHAGALTNLPPGKFTLTMTPANLRLEWRPKVKQHGGPVMREVMRK